MEVSRLTAAIVRDTSRACVLIICFSSVHKNRLSKLHEPISHSDEEPRTKVAQGNGCAQVRARGSVSTRRIFTTYMKKYEQNIIDYRTFESK